MKIAVFMPNWIGDAVMATPALRTLRNQFPQAEIVAVLRPYVADVLDGLDLVDRSIPYQPRGSEASQRGGRFLRRLQREQFETVVLFPNSLRTGWLAWRSGAKRRVGISRNGRGIFLTDRLPAKSKRIPHPAMDEYLRIVESLGCDVSSRRTELATTTGDRAALESFWCKQSLEVRQRSLVCLNPGGAFGASKHWPTQHFAQIARQMASERQRTVLVLCGPAERDEARKIVQAADHPFVISTAEERPSIGLTKAAIEQCELLITTDSGPRHFAQPFDVPVVTLFGATDQRWSETFYERAIPLQLDLECGPCQKRTCPLGHHRCMRDLSVHKVYGAASLLLTNGSSQKNVA